jgi:hypothetical protein
MAPWLTALIKNGANKKMWKGHNLKAIVSSPLFLGMILWLVA